MSTDVTFHETTFPAISKPAQPDSLLLNPSYNVTDSWNINIPSARTEPIYSSHEDDTTEPPDANERTSPIQNSETSNTDEPTSSSQNYQTSPISSSPTPQILPT